MYKPQTTEAGRPAPLPHYQPVEVEGLPEPTIFFYGGAFSNFVGGPYRIAYPQPWWEDGRTPIARWYPTVEHFFQASKARSKHDHEHIRLAPGPGRAKARGRSLYSFEPGCARIPLMREDWEQGTTRYDVMVAGLRAKFENPDFRQALLATAEYGIAEDSPTDALWGIRDEEGGLGGQNLLGKALMQIRDEIRREQTPAV